MHPPNPEQKQQPAQQQQQIKNSFNIFEVIHRPEFHFFLFVSIILIFLILLCVITYNNGAAVGLLTLIGLFMLVFGFTFIWYRFIPQQTSINSSPTIKTNTTTTKGNIKY